MGYRGDAILQFDWTVGEIMKALKEQGIADNTMVILTSDNGPVVNDGYADQAIELLGDHRPWGELRGGKYSIFEAGTRVPFIVSWPARIKPGVSQALVSHIDLMASMAALIGAQQEDSVQTDSQNQLPALLGVDRKGRDYIIKCSQTLSISDGTWKYIAPCRYKAYSAKTRTETGYSKEDQLYNLREDVGEKNNVALNHPKKVEELRELLEAEKAKGCVIK